MYRRFRLSTHRKNEFRKAKAARQQGVTAVTLTVESVHDSVLDLSQPLCPPAPLIVSVPLQSVSLFTVFIDKSVYLHAPVRSLTTLRSRLQALPVLPKGDLTLILAILYLWPTLNKWCTCTCMLLTLCRMD